MKVLTELAEKGKCRTPDGVDPPSHLQRFPPHSHAHPHVLITTVSRHLSELGCSVQHLALAWLAVNPNTSTVILGASKPEQVVDNLKALDVIPKLTPEILEKIEKILDNRPSPYVR